MPTFQELYEENLAMGMDKDRAFDEALYQCEKNKPTYPKEEPTAWEEHRADLEAEFWNYHKDDYLKD